MYEPDNPRSNDKGKPRKYEAPFGIPAVLDVHPCNVDRVADLDVDLWVTEGVKKGDALTSAGECAILATFSKYEGFQMLLTEAMASGAAVVGFDAGGGREFLTKQYAWPVPAGDMVTFAERIEEVVASWDRETGEVQERTGGAVDFVHKTNTLEREAAEAVAGIRAAVRIAEQRPVVQRFTVAEVPRVAEATKRRVKAVGQALLRGQ